MVPMKGHGFVSWKLNYCKFRDLEPSGFTVRIMPMIQAELPDQTASAGLA